MSAPDTAVPPPQPAPDPDSAGFWAATRRGEVALRRCPACLTWYHPPLERCRTCWAETEFQVVSGRGRVVSHIVSRHPSVPGYGSRIPYVVVSVELDEQPGLRMIGLLDHQDGPMVEPEPGQRVRAAFSPLSGGDHTIVTFVLDRDRAQ